MDLKNRFSDFINKIYEKTCKTHLDENCMDYLEHCKFSLGISYHFIFGFWGAIVHAFVPSFYTTSSSDTSKLIQNILKSAGCEKEE